MSVEVSLGDVITHQKGFAFKSKDYQKTGVPVVRVSNFTSDSIDCSALYFVSKQIADANENVELLPDDTVIATVGSWPSNPASIVGKTIRVPSDARGALLNQNAVRLRVRDGDSDDQIFLYYVLKNQRFSDYLISTAQGSANQASITLKDIFGYRFEWPEKEKRVNVARIFDALDSKIQLNRQTNQTLEQIAQAIFKSWFVDFEPVKAKVIVKEKGGSPLVQSLAAQAMLCGAITLEQLTALENDYRGLEAQLHPLITQRFPKQHGLDYWSPEQLQATAELFPDALVGSELGEVPEGWVCGSLSDIARYPSERIDISKLTPRNYVSTENMIESKKGITNATALPTVKSVPSFTKGQVLVSNIRPYFKKIWFARHDGGRSADVLGFESLEDGCEEFLYNALYQDRFFDYMMQGSKGVKMPRGDKVSIMNYPMLISPVQIRNEYSRFVAQFYAYIESLLSENVTLSQLRDTLLPKLLSGEVDLSFSNEESREATR